MGSCIYCTTLSQSQWWLWMKQFWCVKSVVESVWHFLLCASTIVSHYMPQGLNSTVITHWGLREGTTACKVKTSTCVLVVVWVCVRVCVGWGMLCHFIVHVALYVLRLWHLFELWSELCCSGMVCRMQQSFHSESQHIHSWVCVYVLNGWFCLYSPFFLLSYHLPHTLVVKQSWKKA